VRLAAILARHPPVHPGPVSGRSPPALPTLSSGQLAIAPLTSTPAAPPQHHRRRLAALVAGAGAGLLLLAAGLASGATAATAGWTATGRLPGLTASERIWDVVFAPNDASLAAAATDNGVYLSRDGGQTWGSAGLAGTPVWSVAFDPASTPDTLFAGLQGKGGIRSTADLGVTWRDDSTGLPNRDVRCLVVSPSGFAAGTDDGVALSQNGSSWYSAGLSGDSVSSLALVSSPPSATLFAGIDHPTPTAGYLFQLTLAAGSSKVSSWAPVSSGLPASTASNPLVVNAIAAGPVPQSAPSPLLVLTSKGAFRSGDGGKTWTSSNGLPSGTTLTDATFSPLDPNLVYAGSDAGGSSGGGAWRSMDGGQTFSDFGAGLPTAHPAGQSAPREVEALAVADGKPYPTVIAAVNAYGGTPIIYRQVDASAPSPPALPAVGQVPTIPASAAPTQAATSAPPPNHHGRSGSSSTPLVARVAGAVFHFPVPLVFEVLLVLVVLFVWIRWRRNYYVAGPP
jgi:hypothetical protein